jgi:hypothetical protein
VKCYFSRLSNTSSTLLGPWKPYPGGIDHAFRPSLDPSRQNKYRPAATVQLLTKKRSIFLSFIAQHIAAEKLSSPPESYSETILSLGSIGALDQAFAEEFARIAKLRNVLVHLYDNVDHNFLFSLVPKLIQDSKRFVKEIASFLG